MIEPRQQGTMKFPLDLLKEITGPNEPLPGSSAKRKPEDDQVAGPSGVPAKRIKEAPLGFGQIKRSTAMQEAASGRDSKARLKSDVHIYQTFLAAMPPSAPAIAKDTAATPPSPTIPRRPVCDEIHTSPRNTAPVITPPTQPTISYPRAYNFPNVQFEHDLQLYTDNKLEGMITVYTTGKGTKAAQAQLFIEKKKPVLRIMSYLPSRTLWRYLQDKEAVLLGLKPGSPSSSFYIVLREFLSVNDVVNQL